MWKGSQQNSAFVSKGDLEMTRIWCLWNRQILKSQRRSDADMQVLSANRGKNWRLECECDHRGKKKKTGTKTSRALPFPGRIRAEGLTRTVSGDSGREKADVEEAEKIVTHTRIVKTTSSRSGPRGTPGLRGQQLALIAGCDRNAKLWPGGSRSD